MSKPNKQVLEFMVKNFSLNEIIKSLASAYLNCADEFVDLGLNDSAKQMSINYAIINKIIKNKGD